MEEHKAKLDKEYEGLMGNFTKEMESLQQKHMKELEKKVLWCIMDRLASNS